MKKITFLSLCFLLGALQSFSQRGSLQIGAGLSNSVFDKQTTYSPNLHLNATYGISKKSVLTLNYSSFNYRYYNLKHQLYTLGYNYKFSKNFYAIAEAGVFKTGNYNRPLLGAGLGFQTKINNRISVFTEAKQYFSFNNGYSSYWPTVNVGVRINLGKLNWKATN